LTKLTKLHLNNNSLKTIPDWIGNFTELTELYLWGNQIEELPASIAHLTKLTELSLGRNPLKIIPDWIGNLTELIELYLYEAQIEVLPESITHLTKLNKLDINDNQLKKIPDWIGNLTELKELYLRKNQIETLPDSISQLHQLSIFGIGGNPLKTIPDWIGNLAELTELFLWDNQIEILPESIAHLTKLTILNLSENSLKTIPDWIVQLVNLELLDLARNQIEDVPDSLIKLDNLKTLRLSGNPLPISSEILRQGWGKQVRDPGNPKAILDYICDVRDPEQNQTLYEAKLLLVGEPGAGKTSLANKLINTSYQLKPEIENTSTQGIDILDWEFPGTNGNPYKIHIWDFGGQEIYHQTHQFFLTERALYLLVADSRKENTDHYFWLQTIQLLGKDSPVHLIQNEKQNRTCNLNTNQLRGEFANLKDTHRINLADDRGLDDLRLTLQRQLEHLLPQGIPFPNKWLNVRYTLENDTRNYLTYPDYQTICRRNGITCNEEMCNLSRFLHELGILLHFQKDPVLRHRIILKPNWGTAAVYKILDNEIVKENLGQFTDTDLENIWSDAQYADMRHELLQLMKEFKVCYEIPRRPGNYIAPHLLNANAPDYPWTPDQNLILRYRYKSFMPKGILTRFIVEMHRDIENVNDPANAHVWKNGVILAHNNARAEIIEHYPHREIHIRVIGSRSRDLLTIINRKFEEIHEDFYGETFAEASQPFETLIPCNCPTCKPRQNPYLYPLDRLHTYLDRYRPTIECYESGDDVNVRGLIDGVLERERDEINYPDFDRGEPDYPDFDRFDDQPEYVRNSDRSRRSSYRTRQPNPQPAAPNVYVTVNANNKQEQTMTEQSQKINNFNGPMSGVIGSDNATVENNTFNQTNNANTAELLQLIASLRQTAATFPTETKEEIETDLEDLEAELGKPPEQRNNTRIKKRLIALFTAATMIAGSVANVTDFTNTAIDLGQKLNLDLPALVGR
ncbi:MAG: hypothetical protein B0A82_05270, partial [Alkalinema sp. CACIAM 70d]